MLNSAQRAAVEAPEPRVRILAGAGTGKSRVIVARALWLAAAHWRVRLVTFSRRGVRVLRSRLEVEDPHLTSRIAVDTHHGLAAQILRDHGARIGWRPGWQIVDRVEEKALKREAKDQLDLLDSRLARANLRTYDSLLPAAVRLLRAWPEVAEDESEFCAMLVDEAHDSSSLEWELDELLQGGSLTIVGDPAQRIYGWRAAVPFELLPVQWAEYSLPTNYRSGSAILAEANRLPIPGRVDLIQGRDGGPGTVERWEGPSDEALIARLLQDEDFSLDPSSWAVLTRVNRRAESMAKQIRGAKIPVYAPRLEAQTWETPGARSLLDALHVLACPEDSLHLARVLPLSRAQLLEAEAGRANPCSPLSLWEWCWDRHGESTPVGRWLRYLETLRSLGTGHEAAQALVAGDEAQREAADQIPEGLSISETLAWVADPERDEAGAEGCCYVGTIHSAKGEEYDHVLVLGMEEGSIPIGRWRTGTRDESDRLAEECRILYVAITRARHRLILARVTERYRRGRGVVPVQASRWWQGGTP